MFRNRPIPFRRIWRKAAIAAALTTILASTSCTSDDFWSIDQDGCVQFVDGLRYPALDYRNDQWFVLGELVGTSVEEDDECIAPVQS